MTKRVPSSTRGIGEDEAARLFDDAVDRRQPEAGALADLLGREEGLEDLRQRPSAMPRPCRLTRAARSGLGGRPECAAQLRQPRRSRSRW